jgi:type II secretory pathway pseudopilin PulG
MNKLISAVAVAAALAVPAISFAQTSQQGLTRAQVRAELAQLEQAGYNPTGDHVNYPENLQAAQARVTEQQLANSNTSGYGAPAAGTSQAGYAVQPAQVRPQQSVYFGH